MGGTGSEEEPAQMESRVFMHSAAASFAGHMVLAVGLFFAEAHPFDYVPPELIAVDIVSSKEISSLEKEAEPPQTPSVDALDIPDDKPQADTKEAPAPAQSTPPQSSPATARLRALPPRPPRSKRRSNRRQSRSRTGAIVQCAGARYQRQVWGSARSTGEWHWRRQRRCRGN